MEDWQKRIVDEQRELEKKICKLLAFLKGQGIKKLDSTNKELLEKQFSTMCKYRDILNSRISLFEE